MAGKFFKIGSIFLLFAMKVDKGHAHRSRGKSPASAALSDSPAVTIHAWAKKVRN